MPTYSGVGIQNPYPSSQVTGGSIIGDADTGHRIRQIDEVIDFIEPLDTVFLTGLQAKAKKATQSQTRVENQFKRPRVFTTTLAGASYSTTGTSLNFGTTNIKFLQKGAVLLVESEIFWCSADPDLAAGTIAVRFAQGGTTNANHAQNVAVKIIGTATPLNGPDLYVAPTVYGDFIYNNMQRFLSGILVDELVDVTPDRQFPNGKKSNTQMFDEARYQKLMLNQAVMFGKRQDGSVAVGTDTPALMNGVKSYLTSNVTTIANGRPLSVYDVEQLTATIWQQYRKVATEVHCNMQTKRCINRLLNPFREGTLTDTDTTLKFDQFTLETGTFDFVVDPDMEDGELWGLDFSEWTFFTYQGFGWHTFSADPQRLANQEVISGVFSILPRREPIQWRITGFSTNLDFYPSVGL